MAIHLCTAGVTAKDLAPSLLGIFVQNSQSEY